MSIFGGFRNILRRLMTFQKFSFKSEHFGTVLTGSVPMAQADQAASKVTRCSFGA